MPTEIPDSQKALLEDNIRRTVSEAALKRLRGFASELEEEDRFARRFSLAMLACVAVATLILFAAMVAFRVGPFARTVTLDPAVTDARSPARPETQLEAGKPNRVFVGSRVAEDPHVARYVAEWKRHIESYGAAHYPQNLRDVALEGKCIVTAAIRSDGTLESVQIDKSSGSRDIDDAARALIRNASPFAPFSDEMKQKVDVLHVSQTYTFERSAPAADSGPGVVPKR